MSRISKIRATLEDHLKEKIANQKWLYKSINGRNIHFPYKLVEKEATIAREIIYPNDQSARNPSIPEGNLPLYLVNVPMAHRPEEEGYETFEKLMKLFKEESFGTNVAESQKEIKERFCLVIGINQIHSIDTRVNRLFKNWLKNMPRAYNVPYRVFGFFWKPNWVKTDANPRIYRIETAFTLLKHLSKPAASRVRNHFEGGKGKLSQELIAQIPYQRIRDKIKESDLTAAFAKKYDKEGKSSPIYLAVMDADAKALKRKIGLFTRFDKAIKKNDTPSAITLGYRVIEPDRPLLELGVKLDMVCRAAMNGEIPYSAYFPEPCSLFCIKKPNEKLMLDKVSFIGPGRGLENRRFIENGLRNEVLERDSVFITDGGVATNTPPRMKTKKNGEVKELTPVKLQHKGNLQALRGVSQTHVHPKHWADSLYAGLDFKASKVTDATGPMMRLFSVYDPLSRMLTPTEKRFSNTIINDVITNYDEDLKPDQKKQLAAAKKDLKEVGMKKSMIDKIEKAATASGEAIHKLLSKELGY